MNDERTCAYFSMEIALTPEIPTYCGGLGVLAGDTVRSAADLGLSMVAVTLVHRKGYFRQTLTEDGWQRENPDDWWVEELLEELPERACVSIAGREVKIRTWKFDQRGIGGKSVPVLLLDTDLKENESWDRTLTHYLYGGDSYYRLCQEVVLGIGGVRMLRALGYSEIKRFHMNEGHSALLALELLEERLKTEGRIEPMQEDIDYVRKQCIFTTHTPIAAGHDKFSNEIVRSVLGSHPIFAEEDLILQGGVLNMTFLGFNLSHYLNGVAKRHGEISRKLFTNYTIDSITNGVHAATWVSSPLASLFDKYIDGWRRDNSSLRYALNLPQDELWQAHSQAKSELLNFVASKAGVTLRKELFTLGFARRMTEYKRPTLLFSEPERLRQIGKTCGGLQVVYAGKAHPHDKRGAELIHALVEQGRSLHPEVTFVFVPDYDIEVAKYLVSGVDLWLNTPNPPLEASGTSGMKAALNGVPSLSVLDGWWIEGCIEGRTGWAIGHARSSDDQQHDDSEVLYYKLESTVAPLFFKDRAAFIDVMRHAIALNGSFFTTERMLQSYVTKAYF
jgi:starch phosphorylase